MTIKCPPETKIPNNLPDYERARFLKVRLAEGWSKTEILDDYVRIFYASDIPYTQKLRRDAFGRILRVAMQDPRKWDPDTDEVLIERALLGDREAWLSLSHYERREGLGQLCDLYDRGVPHPRWPHLRSGMGMAEWERAVGEPPGRVADVVNKRRERERKARSASAA